MYTTRENIHPGPTLCYDAIRCGIAKMAGVPACSILGFLAHVGRKRHREYRPGAAGNIAGLHLDASAVFGDDPMADPQAQAVSGRALAGNEGLKQATPGLRGDAVAVVGDKNAPHARLGGSHPKLNHSPGSTASMALRNRLARTWRISDDDPKILHEPV